MMMMMMMMMMDDDDDVDDVDDDDGDDEIQNLNDQRNKKRISPLTHKVTEFRHNTHYPFSAHNDKSQAGNTKKILILMMTLVISKKRRKVNPMDRWKRLFLITKS